MKTTIISVFTEFMKLSYVSSTKPRNSFEDLKIDEYIICRRQGDKVSIIYLHNGARFIIPSGWADIFSSFNVFLGSRLNYIGLLDEENSDSEVIIYLMTKLFINLEKKLINTDIDEVLDILGELGIRNTDKFREWCKTEFNIDLEPLEFISLNGNIKI